MKKITLLLVATVCTLQAIFSQSVSINNDASTADASAVLDVKSTTKGMLIPRMTTAQRNAIASAATGLLVFDTSTGSFWFKSNGNWVELVDNLNDSWKKLPNTTDLYRPAGNIGIGTAAPQVKLQVEGGTDLNASNGGFVQLGAPTSVNMALDNNEIQARNNAVASKLYLQNAGGELQIGGNPSLLVSENAQLYRNLPLSAKADLLPIAYGKINYLGTVLSGTGNFSVTRIDGDYRIALLGEANLYLNRDKYTILLTAHGYGGHYMITSQILSDNSIFVYISIPYISYDNSACITDCPTSFINSGIIWKTAQTDFSILIYKM